MEDYYKDSCLDAKVQSINTPTLFLNAADDMFSPERAFPLDKIRANPYTAMVMTKYGGHISFCEGLLPTGCNYTCRIVSEYLQIVIDKLTEAPQDSKLASQCSTTSEKVSFDLFD